MQKNVHLCSTKMKAVKKVLLLSLSVPTSVSINVFAEIHNQNSANFRWFFFTYFIVILFYWYNF